MNKESNNNVYLGGKGEIYPLITMEEASKQKPESKFSRSSGIPPQFRSRWAGKLWIRVVALIIAAVFVSEQASWAGITDDLLSIPRRFNSEISGLQSKITSSITSSPYYNTATKFYNFGMSTLNNTLISLRSFNPQSFIPLTNSALRIGSLAISPAFPAIFGGMKLASSILSLRSPLSDLNFNQQIISPISKYALGFTSTLTSWANKLPNINSFSSLNNIFTSLRSFNPQSFIPLTNSALRIGSLAISPAFPAIFGGMKLASSILSLRSPLSDLNFNQQVLKPLTDFGSNFNSFRIGDIYQKGLLNKANTPAGESGFIFDRLTNIFLQGQLGLMNRYIDRKAGFKF